MKLRKSQLFKTLGLLFLTATAWADDLGLGDGGTSEIDTFWNNTGQFLVKNFALGFLLVMAIVVGIKMANGDDEALDRGKYLLIGGAVIFLAKPILSALMSMAGYH